MTVREKVEKMKRKYIFANFNFELEGINGKFTLRLNQDGSVDCFVENNWSIESVYVEDILDINIKEGPAFE